MTLPGGWHSRIGQLLRYGSVSVIATLTSLTVLVGLVATNALAPAAANVAATFAGMVPSFELNRRWVWGATGRPSLRRQVVPFVALSLTGLLLSTVAVQVAADVAAGAGWSHAVTTLAVSAANLAAFGVVWIAQFVILDRVLFGAGARRGAAVSEAPDDAGSSPRRSHGPDRRTPDALASR
jgi:putative flippase GtrA